MSESPDSYSAFERKYLAPARKVLRGVYRVPVKLLIALRVTPNLVSFSQIIVGAIVVALIPTQPRLAFILFILALMLDGIDGALARETNRASKFGALFDQYCDHAREVIVVAGFALHGALNPFLAGLYGLAYPAFNFTIYICNANRAPVPFAIKSYAVVYPALFLYLWFGVNVLDYAVALSISLMTLVIALGLNRLRRGM
ncbi:MAG: CDP-alcohol phosphatidyltransferase family protein [Chloroflexi bacterium]|nr:CDP-alcohol phosphatidyltransferase family protein [Chloroflexota bacterium]MBI3741170.1 CDP-alcohol phosphatidyltransferase family protein [Chloroflexota bacterium]